MWLNPSRGQKLASAIAQMAREGVPLIVIQGQPRLLRNNQRELR
jgi:hypothetical protein